MAEIAGEEHSKLVQLGLEYDPTPPFNSGAPEKASPKAMAGIAARYAALASDRDARVRAIAEKLAPAA